jgi:DNA-binding transcriptional regulator YiaG
MQRVTVSYWVTTRNRFDRPWGQDTVRLARQAEMIETRYFAGLSIPETAELLGVSVATLNRDWRAARAWLASELHHDG